MRKRFRPVFPGMRTGVLADEGVSVIGSIGTVVIFLKGIGVILGLVPENQPVGSSERGLRDRKLPIEMTDLMSKMPQQGPVRLPEGGAPRFALDIVGFRNIERDESGQMPRQNRASRSIG